MFLIINYYENIKLGVAPSHKHYYLVEENKKGVIKMCVYDIAND